MVIDAECCAYDRETRRILPFQARPPPCGLYSALSHRHMRLLLPVGGVGETDPSDLSAWVKGSGLRVWGIQREGSALRARAHTSNAVRPSESAPLSLNLRSATRVEASALSTLSTQTRNPEPGT